MKRPTPDQLAELNRRMIAKSGGTFGVADRQLLESACAVPFAGLVGQEFYPTLFLKAAALARSIVQNDPFVDGNKRTGVAAALVFLRVNGYTVEATDADYVDLGERLAVRGIGVEEVASWLEAHSKPVGRL